jgi:hypothetical protein
MLYLPGLPYPETTGENSLVGIKIVKLLQPHDNKNNQTNEEKPV